MGKNRVVTAAPFDLRKRTKKSYMIVNILDMLLCRMSRSVAYFREDIILRLELINLEGNLQRRRGRTYKNIHVNSVSAESSHSKRSTTEIGY